MPAIKAHFDGRVFVPDEPVELPVGHPVMVYRAATWSPARSAVSCRMNRSCGRCWCLSDPEAARRLICDPESGLENF